MDAAASRAGHRADHRRALPQWACLARFAGARLVASAPNDPRTRTRRGCRKTLDSRQVAPVKKNAARRRATIVFLDESGFSQRPSVRRTWAPRGETPVLVHRHRTWERLSAIGALGYPLPSRRDRVFLMLHQGNVTSVEIVRFLKHLHRHIRTHVILLWDGLQAHRSTKTKAFIGEQNWLSVERLPSYSPDLNPVEAMWSWLPV